MIFSRFYDDLTKLTPHAVERLRADLGMILEVAQHGSQKLYGDAGNLVAFVNSTAWDQDGSLLSRPVVRMASDCGQ